MRIRQITHIIFQYPEDYMQEYEWCKTKSDVWVHKSQDTQCSVYENEILYSIGIPIAEQTEPSTERHLPDYSYEADLGRRIIEQTDCAWK